VWKYLRWPISVRRVYDFVWRIYFICPKYLCDFWQGRIYDFLGRMYVNFDPGRIYVILSGESLWFLTRENLWKTPITHALTHHFILFVKSYTFRPHEIFPLKGNINDELCYLKGIKLCGYLISRFSRFLV